MIKTQAISSEKFVLLALNSSEIPAGIYNGTWSGYEAYTTINGEDYRFKTEDGIRAINAPCIITVTDGKVTVEAK